MAVLATLGGIAFVVLYAEGRGTSFFFDEWDIILRARENTASAFLTPHNGHLYLVPIAIYHALFALVGLHHYGPYRLAAIVLHLAVCFFVFVLLRRSAGPWVAVIGAGLILFLGRAWQDLIWPFQMGYLASLAGGLGALAAFGRAGRRYDLLASGLLLFSLASSGLGIPLAAGVTVAILLSGRPFIRLWVVIAPMIVYGAWYLHYGQNQASSSNITAAPGYVFDSFGGAVGAVTGLGRHVERPEAAVVLALLVVAAVLHRPRRSILVPLTVVVSFWALTGLSRAQLHEPAASRYLYPGAIMLVLVVGELLHGVAIPRPLLVGLAVLTALAAGLNMVTLRDAATTSRTIDQTVDAELRGLEIERGAVAATFQPDPSWAPQVTAGPYFQAIDDLGSPALPLSLLPAQSGSLRAAVDGVMARAVPPSIVRLSGDPRRARCRSISSRAEVAVPAAGLVVVGHAPVGLSLRRYGDPGSKAFTSELPAGALRVRLDRGSAPLPWRASLESRRPFLAC
jgi:hypothetical protein